SSAARQSGKKRRASLSPPLSRPRLSSFFGGDLVDTRRGGGTCCQPSLDSPVATRGRHCDSSRPTTTPEEQGDCPWKMLLDMHAVACEPIFCICRSTRC